MGLPPPHLTVAIGVRTSLANLDLGAKKALKKTYVSNTSYDDRTGNALICRDRGITRKVRSGRQVPQSLRRDHPPRPKSNSHRLDQTSYFQTSPNRIRNRHLVSHRVHHVPRRPSREQHSNWNRLSHRQLPCSRLIQSHRRLRRCPPISIMSKLPTGL